MVDIPRALFSIGEIAIVAATDMPHYDVQILSIHYNRTQGYGYIVAPDLSSDPNRPWAESVLRKKHKPGASFSQLMADLTNPSHIAEPVKE